ncbi:pyridoxamine 5'-phosphate oxidase family protein [Novosphingobium kaempferiae]|uniref:pyridoxamine 5'-phosphate oxidase family protein n=1 Tax=Novosphingobium kaempferiae TaxID=2896849 RepID=UPI001E32DD0C|nr:pyridoxamine 5'-phosphate oxidase family protein [Novosphingobium kaempferiae]
MTGSTDIASIEALEAVVGQTPPAMHLKVIDHLDAGALAWLSRSPLAFLGFGSAQGLRVTLAGCVVGYADGDARTLRIPLAMLDEPALAVLGAHVGALFLLPGVGETLRINGRVSGLQDGAVQIEVCECYGHCAKAMIRSRFWDAAGAETPREAAPFTDAVRFVALASMSARGWADLSPKGDPAGGMVQLEHRTLWFADRPGNRRLDSLRNIIEQPRVALALLVPGSTNVARVHGQARITTDPAIRERFAVQGKVPSLAIGVEIAGLELRESAALKRAALWPVTPEKGIEPTKLFLAHIKLNRNRGWAAALARASIAVPGMSTLMQKGLEKDYKDNLY